MKYLAICFLLLSCNVVKTLTGGETKPSSDFFDGNCGTGTPTDGSNALVGAINSETINSHDGCGYNEAVDLADGLVSFYKLNESSNTRTDSGNFSNDLTDYASTIINHNVSSRTGMDCSGYVSATEYVDKSSSVIGMNFGNNGNFTISFWVYRLSDPGSDMYILKTDNLEILSPNWDNASLQIKVDGLQTSTALGIGTNVWEHIVIKYDRINGFYVYFNGSNYHHDSTSTSAVNIVTSFLSMCSNTGGNNNFDGYLDSFGIWNRLLNGSEVRALYDGSNNLD